MIHKKLLSLLVLLMTVASGAWADIAVGNVFKTGSTIDFGTTSVIYKTYSGSSDNSTLGATGKQTLTYQQYTSGKHWFKISTGSGNQSIYIVSDNTAEPWGIRVSGGEGTMGNPYSFEVLFEEQVSLSINNNKDEATFTMPASDATVNYEIVRDLAQQTSVDLIIGTGDAAVTATADTRLRIQKDNDYGYLPVSALSCNFVDQIEGNTILPTDFDDAKLTPLFYLQGEDDTWNLVTNINTTTHLPNNLLPGQVYRITLKAADGSYYDGETQPSYTVTLFEGYEVKVPAGEYVTFYKDEPLYADPVSSTDAVLYTISSVSTTDGTATLSDAIATAPSSTPLLVYNSNTSQDKTFLLIPATAEPNLALTVAPEFQGTLTGTTIAASTDGLNNYALNGKKFIWVMEALPVAANKAWLAIPTELNARTINLVFDDGNATGLDGVTRTAEQNGDYYDLNGRKLDKKPTRKGVYIQNGRKVVIK